MYSDIIPPKKSIQKIKPSRAIEKEEAKDLVKAEEGEEIVFAPYKKTYHTIDGRDTSSRWPYVLGVIAIIILGTIIYSKYNHTTTFVFEPKTTTFEIKESIVLVGADEVLGKGSSSLPYSLVYVPTTDVNNLPAAETSSSTASSSTTSASSSATRNPFTAQKNATSSTSAKEVVKSYTMTASTTKNTKNIIFVNKKSTPVSLRETTRISVGDVIYNLDKSVTIQPTPKAPTSASSSMYHIVGFKDTTDYDQVYAIEANAKPGAETVSAVEGNSSNTIPPTDIISLLPKTSLPLLKSNIYDKNLDQNAVVVIEQKDLEQVLQKINPNMQDYIKSLEPLVDIVKYHITIVDYALEVSAETGRPAKFKSLTIEVTPIIYEDKVKTVFANFSNDAMKKIQAQIKQYIDLEIKHFPFWMTDVPNEDMIRVEVSSIAK